MGPGGFISVARQGFPSIDMMHAGPGLSEVKELLEDFSTKHEALFCFGNNVLETSESNEAEAFLACV